MFKLWKSPSSHYEKMSPYRDTFWVGQVRNPWASIPHVDSDRLLKCPNQANCEEVMHVQTLEVLEFWLWKKCVSLPRHTFWVGQMGCPWKSTLHVDSDTLVKCSKQAHCEEVMPVQSLAVPEMYLWKKVFRYRDTLFGVGKMRIPWKFTLHVDNDRLLKCPKKTNCEEVMPVQSLAAPGL